MVICKKNYERKMENRMMDEMRDCFIFDFVLGGIRDDDDEEEEY